jgi:hypothetical protein
VVWLLAAWSFEPVARLFLLAPLVVVPLGLSLAATPTRDGDHALVYRLAATGQPPAGALVVAAMTLPAGPVAAGLVVPRLATTVLLAAFGL